MAIPHRGGVMGGAWGGGYARPNGGGSYVVLTYGGEGNPHRRGGNA